MSQRQGHLAACVRAVAALTLGLGAVPAGAGVAVDLSAMRTRVRDPSMNPELRRAAAADLVAARRAEIEVEADPTRRAGLLLDQAEDLLMLAMPLEGDDLAALVGRGEADERRRVGQAGREALACVVEAESIAGAAPVGAADAAFGAERRRRDFLGGVARTIVAELDDPPEGVDASGDPSGDRCDRMRVDAVAALGGIIIDLEPTTRRIARDHLAVALAALGRIDEASQLVRAAEADVGAGERERLRSALVEVRLAERSSSADGAIARASRRLESTVGERPPPDVASRLLVADARCRLALADAGSPRQRLARAAASYRALMTEGAPSERDVLRPLAMRRLASLAVASADAAALPSLVVVAAAALRAEASETRDAGVAELRGALRRDDLAGAERLVAARALACALADAGDASGAARVLLEEATRDPHEPEARSAIERAAELALEARRGDPAVLAPAESTEATQLLRRTIDALLDRFPELGSRDRWRVESARLWLEQGETARAIDDVRLIRGASPWWPAARAVAAAAMVQAARSDVGADAPAAWGAAVAECDSALVGLAAVGDGEPRAASARESAAIVAALRAAALAGLGDTIAALRALDEIVSHGLPSAIADQVDRTRIEILVGAGRGADAAAAARTFARRSSGEATGVLAALLAARRDQVETLLDQGRDDEARLVAAEVMAPLAAALDELVAASIGGIGQVAPSSAAWLVAESLRLAGRHGEALPRLDALLLERPDAVELLAAKADCLAHAPPPAMPEEPDALPSNRRDQRLAEAMTILKRIAAGRRAARDRWFWWAETLQLEILRAADRNTEQIAPRVEQLRAIDRSLGGERWRRRLEAVAIGSPGQQR